MGLRGVGLAVVLVHGAAHTGDVTGQIETRTGIRNGDRTKTRSPQNVTVTQFRVGRSSPVTPQLKVTLLDKE